MSDCSFGLLGSPNDPQIRRLASALVNRGQRVAAVDLTDLPAHGTFHWEGDNLLFKGSSLLDHDLFFARGAHFPMPTFIPGRPRDEAEKLTFPVRETGSLLNAIVDELAEQRPMVNPPAANRYHGLKPRLYRTLQRAGVPVPEFAVGCDLKQAALFVDGLGECAVIKPLMGGEVYAADLDYLKEHHAEIDHRPFLLQRRITGRSFRCYCAGGRVVAAAEIVHGDVVDWRNDVQKVTPIELSEEDHHSAAQAASVLGLYFAGVDIEQDAHGRGWVIDVNPSPMFAGFEQLSGLDVAGPLAETLIELAGQAGHRS